jgi:hypothetical protein
MSQGIKMAAILAAAAACSFAQWVNYRDPATPRTRDGKPNLTAAAPRAANGKPDLSGVWQVEPTPADELKRLYGDLSAISTLGDDPRSMSKYVFNIFADLPRSEEPVRPEAVRILRERAKGGGANLPTTLCLPGGLPFIYMIPTAFKVIQTPKLIAIIHEGDGTFRQIYTDGRKHPADPQPLWMGYSVGTWQADTLVVDTVGFNDKSWLDGSGHPHSDALHLTERIRRRDFGHLDMEVTIDDPKMYTRALTIKLTESLQPDSDILESICAEDEKDRVHLEKR